jgi:poly-gamma-glutamate system protein
MHRFRAKSNIVLGLLTAFSLLALIVVENSIRNVKQPWYEEKLEAARLSQKAALCLKHFRLEEGVFIDNINDPNETALIGQESTLITTDRGSIEAKLSSANPNIAAIIVQYLKDAGVRKGDNVAVALTGSFPALNISVIAALEILQTRPLIISSIGASDYGANDPYFTWLDMESILIEDGIFQTKSIAASIGGGSDIGRGLSPMGRTLILNAIERNNVRLINEDNLLKNIDQRMAIYKEACLGNPIKAYINVGGGIASLGHTVNSELIPSGLTQNMIAYNFPVRGVIVQMGAQGIPIIQLMNIKDILKANNMNESTVPLPPPGSGGIFVHQKYNMVITGIATLFMVIIIVLIYLSERKYHKLGTQIIQTPVLHKAENEELVHGL